MKKKLRRGGGAAVERGHDELETELTSWASNVAAGSVAVFASLCPLLS